MTNIEEIAEEKKELIDIRCTALETFNNCPAKYKYYNDWDGTNDILEFGTLVHRYMELLVSDSLTEVGEALILSDLPIGKRQWIQEAGQLVLEYIKENKLTYIISEYSMKETFEDVQIHFHGTFDMLVQDENGDYHMLDFKTAKSARDDKHIDEVLQKKAYPWLLERAQGIEVKSFKYIILVKTVKPKMQIYSYDTDETDNDTMIGIMSNLREATDTGDFKPKANYQCRFCKGKMACPAFSYNY
jgi:putative RecB family exonuclease